MEAEGQGEWARMQKQVNPEFHPDFAKSTSKERHHDPEAAREYLNELRDRQKSSPEEAREEIQKMIAQLENMLNDAAH